MHWTDAFFTELYLDSVEDLLTPELSALEAEVVAELLALSPGQRILDLACGHGRHARLLAGRVRLVAGVDRSGPYLARGLATSGWLPRPPRFVRADLRALPFGEGSFDAVYSWYASLFMYDEAGNASALSELGRVLRRGGRALVQHANPLRLAADPIATARRELADGTVVEEEARFDPATGLERAHRRLRRPDGEVVAATAELRYYRPEEWGALARAAGLRVQLLTSTTGMGSGSSAPGPDAPDLVAVLEKP